MPIQYPTHHGMQVPLCEYIVIKWVETYNKFQITLAGKIRSGVGAYCYNWFEFIAE